MVTTIPIIIPIGAAITIPIMVVVGMVLTGIGILTIKRFGRTRLIIEGVLIKISNGYML
jgi:hypothetical protein